MTAFVDDRIRQDDLALDASGIEICRDRPEAERRRTRDRNGAGTLGEPVDVQALLAGRRG